MRLELLVAALFVLTTIALSSDLNTINIGQNPERVEYSSSNVTMSTIQVDDESYYLELLNAARNQYSEDLGYSSDILDDFVKNNITNREAMTATISIFVISSQTRDMIDQIDPPSEYIMYHTYILYSLKYLNIYLWNMAKFYETGNNEYALRARENFNLSISYYEDGLYELERLL